MKTTILVGLVLAQLCSAGEEYTPTSGYAVREIEGWEVLVNKQLSSHHEDAAERVLKLLGHQLYQISRAVPDEALRELRNVAIWVEYKAPQHKCMCYHPSEQWLREHGFNPDKKRSVEIANADNFLKWTIGQPWMVLHELAHSYHHRVLGHDNSEIRKAFQKAKQSKRYQSVLHISGESRTAYALNNDKEYFAECSEAFFGANDFYPFVRCELQQHDPHMYRLLTKLWKAE
jgi:hypothetical protein